jgi:UDP-N-acetylglucosamine 2-epimerase
MKKLCLPVTARPHLARQQLLIEELKKHFTLDIWEPKQQNSSMSVNSILYAVEFNNYLAGKDYDGIIIRGDRYEMLGLALVGVYKGFKIIHIEGGDESGVIDNKVRHAITHLSDFHFCTNEESHKRLIHMGVATYKVWNFGSLDVEFAAKVEKKNLRDKPYILVAYHPIPTEDEKELEKALQYFDTYDKIKVGSNKDYGKEYGTEQYSPEDYINLMRGAEVCVGNSSSLIKEASILGVGVVNIGDRQNNRLKPKNVLDVPCETQKIVLGISFQINITHPKDETYYQKDTSKKITSKLKQIL